MIPRKDWGEALGYVSIGMGMALATSSFMILGGMAPLAPGRWILLAIAIAAAIILLLAFSIGELAGLFPGGGGVAAYLKAAFGEKVSLFFMGLYLALVGGLAGMESSLFARMVDVLLPGLPPYLAASAILLAVAAANLAGLEFSRKMQAVTTCLLVAALAGLSLAALGAGGSAPSPGPQPVAPTDLAAAAGMSVFLFMGFEWVTPMGRSPRAYRSLIPLSLLLSVGLLASVYLLCAAALSGIPASGAAGGLPLFALAEHALGAPGRLLAAAISLLIMVNCFNAGMLGAARMVYLLARQGSLPAFLAKTAPDSGNPTAAVLATGAVALASAFVILRFGLHAVVGAVCAAVECFLYSALVMAALRLRRTRPLDPRPFRTPLPAVLQVLVAAALAGLGISALAFDSRIASRGLIAFAVLSAMAAAFSLGAAGLARARATAKPFAVPAAIKEPTA